jgi:hypothetical protein
MQLILKGYVQGVMAYWSIEKGHQFFCCALSDSQINPPLHQYAKVN